MHRLDDLLAVVTVAASAMFAAILVAPVTGAEHGARSDPVATGTSNAEAMSESAATAAPTGSSARPIVRLAPVDVLARRDVASTRSKRSAGPGHASGRVPFASESLIRHVA